MTIGTIILAAGPSTRFGGTAKQLLTINGTALVRHAAETALAAELGGPVVVVLGNRRAEIAPELEGLPITIIDNPLWQTGVASSIKSGLVGLYLTRRDLDGVVLLNVDQPLVTPALLRQLATRFAGEKKGIAACRYAGQLNLPALFGPQFLEPLLDLTGDKSAKWVIIKHRADVVEVSFEPAAVDLDFWHDVHALNARSTT